MKKFWWWGALILALAATGYRFQGPPSWPVVSLQPVRRADLAVRYVASGKLESTRIQVSSRVGGRILAVPVEENQRVHPGQVLVLLEDRERRARVESLASALQASRHQLSEARRSLQLKRAQLQAALSQALARRAQARWHLEKVRRGARRQEIEAARAAVAEAEARAQEAGSDLERVRRLFEEGFVPRSELEEAQTGARVADSQLARARSELSALEEGSRREDLAIARKSLEEAEAAVAAARAGQLEIPLLEERVRAAESQVAELSARLEAARADLEQTVLRAPREAVVARRILEPGEVAGPGQPVLVLVDPGDLRVEAEVDEEDAARVQVGQDVEVHLTAFPGQVFPGRVDRVAPALERKPDTPGDVKILRVQVALARRDPAMRPGMEADVEGRVILARGVLLVPRSAVWREEGTSWVYRLEGGRVRRTQVRTGVESHEEAVVLEGLREGDRVVTRGREELKDGTPVRVR